MKWDPLTGPKNSHIQGNGTVTGVIEGFSVGFLNDKTSLMGLGCACMSS